MWEYRARITNTVDGDTVDAIVDLGFGVDGMAMRLRLLGVDTPERNQLGWAEATQFTKAWIATYQSDGGHVVITTIKDRSDRDKKDSFGRYLAVIWDMAKTQSLNEALLTGGYAKEYVG